VSAQIVAAGPESAGLLAALHAKAFDGGEIWDADAFETLLAGPGVDAIIAVRGEAPLGFILMRTIADEAEMLTLAVLPSARRSGIGRFGWRRLGCVQKARPSRAARLCLASLYA